LAKAGPGDHHGSVSTLQMLGAIARATGDFSVESLSLGPLRPGEVRLRVRAAGMCRTDSEAFHMVELPAVLGHEAVGDVTETFGDCGDIQVGDRVAVSYPSCGACPECAQGRLWLCERNWALSFDGCRLDGSRPIAWREQEIASAFFQQSSFATLANVPARSLVKVSATVPLEVVAALPCGLLTGSGAVTNVLAVPEGGCCAVVGTGAVGLAAIMTARMAGASNIVAIDIHEGRLNLSHELGATLTVNSRRSDAESEIWDLFPGGIPHILDTTGSSQAWDMAMRVLSRGGTFAFVTTPEPVETYSISPFDLFLKVACMKSVLLGATNPREQIPQMLEWWSQGHFPIERLTRTYPLEDINVASKDAKSGRTIKPIIVMPD
jgi:aryl-alcohol dehydrogenase